MMQKTICRVLIALSLWLPGTLHAASNANPEKLISGFHDSLIDILEAKAGQSDQVRYDALQDIMDNSFNFKVMIKTVTSRHWRKADEATRSELLGAFRDVSIATYADQYAGLTDGKFETLGSRSGPRGLQLVDTKLTTPSRKVGLTYVLRDAGGKWQIIDVLLDGGKISELARKASEYSKTLQDGGAKALIQVLEKQKTTLLAD